MSMSCARAIVLATAILGAGCSGDEAPTETVADAPAAIGAQPVGAATGGTSADDAQRANHTDMPALAGAMAAAAEHCGLATRAQNQAGYAAEARPTLVAQGADPSTVDRLFWSAYDAALAEAARIDPAKARADCHMMRTMSDPRELEKLQQGAEQMKALARQLEADGAK